jgi:hypothetical protein
MHKDCSGCSMCSKNDRQRCNYCFHRVFNYKMGWCRKYENFEPYCTKFKEIKKIGVIREG